MTEERQIELLGGELFPRVSEILRGRAGDAADTCRFWAAGTCTKGDECPFEHTEDVSPAQQELQGKRSAEITGLLLKEGNAEVACLLHSPQLLRDAVAEKARQLAAPPPPADLDAAGVSAADAAAAGAADGAGGADAAGASRPDAGGEEGAAGVPSFWLTAMLNEPGLCATVEPYDKEVLEYLVDVHCETTGGLEEACVLQFDFRENPFLRNKTLRKTMHSRIDAEEDGEPMLIRLEGCRIEWKKGKNVTVQVKRKKQKSKTGKGHRHVLIDEPRSSFFNFFSPPDKVPGEDDDCTEKDEERALRDFNQCEAFRQHLIPRAVDHFTGESLKGIQLPEGMELGDLRIGCPGDIEEAAD